MASNKEKQNQKKGQDSKVKFNWLLIPLIVVLAVVPAIIRMAVKTTEYPNYPWYAGSTTYTDFYLVWKGYVIGVVGAVMACCNVVLFARLKKWEKQAVLKRYWPVLGYLFFVILSTIFAVNKNAALWGEFEQGEPFYVLFGYAMIALNVPLVVKTVKDLKVLLVAFFAGVFVVAGYGVLQAFGIEPLNWGFMKYLIMNSEQRSIYQLQFKFEEGRVFSTLFNPNYLGPYVALVLPIPLMYMFVASKVWQKIVSLVLCGMLLVCLVASGSKTGVIICAVVLVFMLLFTVRTWGVGLLKTWYVSIPLLLAVILGGKLVTDYVPAADPQRIINALTIQEDNYNLQGIDTTGDCVKIDYKDSEYEFRFSLSGFVVSVLGSENGKTMTAPQLTYENEYTGSFLTTQGDTIGVRLVNLGNSYYGFMFVIDGKELVFTNEIDKGNYQIVNAYGSLHESIVLGGPLKNYKHFVSGRGYSWSQFLPVALRHSVVGAGPDNYPFAVNSVGDDYAYKYSSGNVTLFFSRPHNMFIQMWVDTGLISLIMFLIFAVWYIVDCCKMYFGKKLSGRMDYMGLACMAGTMGFLGNCMANDSLTCLTPLFWAILACGVCINVLIKEARY